MGPNSNRAFDAGPGATVFELDDERISRVVQRCEVDLRSRSTFEGTGAKITWRRARAVQSLAHGSTAAEAAVVSGLTEKRVTAVAANVTEHGLAALYPTFRERQPHRLTAAQRDQIRGLVRRRSPGRRTTTTGALRDHAVHDGIVADLSDLTLGRVVRRHGKRPDHPPTMASTSPRLELVVGILFVVIGLGGVVALVTAAVESPGVWSIVLFWVILPPLGLALVWSGYHGVRSMRAIASLNDAGTWPPPVVRPHASPAVPPAHSPTVEIVNALELDDPGPAHSDSPPEILYLWVFDVPLVQRIVYSHGWPQLGPMRMLVHVGSVLSRRRRRIRRAVAESVVHDGRTLASHLDELSAEVGRYEVPDLAFGGRAMYEGYPLTSLVCTDRWWPAAFEALFARADLVVVNLSGFSADHPGLSHELATVLRPPSLAREVFLIDSSTDADAAIEFVVGAHEQVAASDPLIFVRHAREELDAGLGRRYLSARLRGGSAAGQLVLDDDIAPDDDNVARRIWGHVSSHGSASS